MVSVLQGRSDDYLRETVKQLADDLIYHKTLKEMLALVVCGDCQFLKLVNAGDDKALHK